MEVVGKKTDRSGMKNIRETGIKSSTEDEETACAVGHISDTNVHNDIQHFSALVFVTIRCMPLRRIIFLLSPFTVVPPAFASYVDAASSFSFRRRRHTFMSTIQFRITHLKCKQNKFP